MVCRDVVFGCRYFEKCVVSCVERWGTLKSDTPLSCANMLSWQHACTFQGFWSKTSDTCCISSRKTHPHALSKTFSLSLPLLSHTHAHARTDAPAHMGAHHVMMILRTLELWRRGVGQSFLVFPPGGYVCITVFVFFVLFLAPSPSPLCGSSNNCTF